MILAPVVRTKRNAYVLPQKIATLSPTANLTSMTVRNFLLNKNSNHRKKWPGKCLYLSKLV